MSRSVFLWVGLLGGIALSLFGLLHTPGPTSTLARSDSAVARVDGVPIPRERFYAMLRSLAAEERAPKLDPAQRKQVLEQLIREELLLGRAEALGLPRADLLARKRLIAAVVESVTVVVGAHPPSDETLRAFYATRPRGISEHEALQVEVIFVSGNDDHGLERARAAALALDSGEPPSKVRERWGSPDPIPTPKGLVPPRTLRSYIGPSAVRAAEELNTGGVSAPIKGSGGYRVVKLIRAQRSPLPPFEQLRDSLRTMWIQREKAKVLDSYLEELRGRSEISIDTTTLEGPIPPPPSQSPP